MLKPVSHAFWLTGIPYGKRLKCKKVLLLTIGLPQNILKHTSHIADLTGRSPPPGHLLSEHFYSTLKKIKSMRYIILTACLAMFIGASCKKNKPTKTELEKLPPITEIGANTFGCLVNGKAWIPKDNYGQASFQLDVDPTLRNGFFGLRAVRYPDIGEFQSISMGMDNCKKTGDYFFDKPHNGIRFADVDKSLELISTDIGTICKGVLNISRYDLQNRVFSGTFECTLYNQVGDTIRITEGRFDKKL